VVKAVKGIPVKVILETSYLAEEEKVTACRLALQAGAAYVKTSTGYGYGGATVDDIRLMRSIVGDQMGIKAAGGIRSYADAATMIEAGATRIGTSAGIAILDAMPQG
jgi:deoxyribose-phosphate aldolase